ncbi:NUDIX hydrolase [Euzebya rosea]|uniref:NUDIX hydrolase n=1 Tax=Euzebya rosea TaxID=2052804 RepID=UPI001300A25C|nr:NUDIX hydrolase [Euzebya rosea]
MTSRPAPVTTPAEAPPTRPAATVLLLRQHPRHGMQVLMLRRHARSGFAASAWVFPGGVVDEGDGTLPEGTWTGIDPDALADRFGLSPTETLAMHAAAVRETFEEAGVLLAMHADGRPADVPADELAGMRDALNDRTVDADWHGFLQRHSLVLDLSAMTYWLRWVTPIQEPKRYDTCFFLAPVPAGAEPAHDRVETTECRWVTPSDIAAGDELPVIFPTWKTLVWMAEHGTVEALLDAAAGQGEVAPIQPHIQVDGNGSYSAIFLPDDDDYPHELYA